MRPVRKFVLRPSVTLIFKNHWWGGWEEVMVVCWARESNGRAKNILTKKIFTQNIFSKNIFTVTKNIFAKNIFAKNIFLKMLPVSTLSLSIICPPPPQLQIRGVKSLSKTIFLPKKFCQKYFRLKYFWKSISTQDLVGGPTQNRKFH